MGKRRRTPAKESMRDEASKDLAGWLLRIPDALLRDWIKAAGGRPSGRGSAGLAAALEALWVDGGRLTGAVESCTGEARSLLAAIAGNDFQVPASQAAWLLEYRGGWKGVDAAVVRTAVDELERAGLVVRLREGWRGDTLIVLPPVWRRVRDLCRPPARLAEGERVAADDHPNRYGPGALMAAAIGRVAQKPVRVTREGRLHRRDRKAIETLLGDYPGDDRGDDERVELLVVGLLDAGLLRIRGERIFPDLPAIDAFAELTPGRQALRLLATASHHSDALARAALAILDAGGAWCRESTLFADAGWNDYAHGIPLRGTSILVDLGLAEAGTATGGTRALRATSILLRAAGGAKVDDPVLDPGSPPDPHGSRAVVQTDFKVLAPESLPLGWLMSLAVHGDLVRSDRMWVFELSPQSVRRAAELGASVEATLALLARVAGGEGRVPAALAETLRGFAGRTPSVRVVRRPVLLFDTPDAVADAESALRSVTAVRRVGPTALELADPGAIDRAGRGLRDAGYAVTDEGITWPDTGSDTPDHEDTGRPAVESVEDLRDHCQESDHIGSVHHHLQLRLHQAGAPKAAQDPDRPGRGALPGRPHPLLPAPYPWETEEAARHITDNPPAVLPMAIQNLLIEAIERADEVQLKVLNPRGHPEIIHVTPYSLTRGMQGTLVAVRPDGSFISVKCSRIVEARVV